MKKLLLSARDPGAAGNIAVIYEDLSGTGLFDITLVASGAAYSMMKHKGLNPDFFEISDGKDHIDPLNETTSTLFEKTSDILKTVKPDAVITGLSSFGAGIDEALSYLSDVPVLAVQDFWGDVNLSLGKPADVYLVMDEFAAGITRQKCGAETEIIGSPKYSRYALFDIAGMRAKSRKCLNASDDEKIIGWFGQHPDIPGYSEVFEDFIEAVGKLEGDFIVIFREHPKFGATGRKHAEFLRSKGIRSNDVTGIGIAEEWISACDLIVTPFSLCGLDHAYLSAFSATPIGTVVYLMQNSLINNFYVETSGIESIPTTHTGIGKWFVSGDNEDLLDEISNLLGDGARTLYHDASKRLANTYIQCAGIVAILLKMVL